MEQLIDPSFIEQWLQTLVDWVRSNVLVLSNLIQLVLIAASFVVGRLSAPHLERLRNLLPSDGPVQRFGAPVVRALVPLAMPFIWLVILWFAVFAAKGAQWPHQLMEGGVSLLTAWVVIRLASGFIQNASWARFVALAAWSVAALNLLGLLDPTLTTLDNMAIRIGEVRISLLGTIKAGLLLTLFLWLAGVASRLLERRMAASSSLSPSVQVLFGKLAKITLFLLAVILALEGVGIDLTAFAVFSGAVGLGIGFGLQKVFSNLMSGVILLLDKSVKPGDVIAIGDTFGWINSLGARYVSVITRDGIEHLIPNEELISQRVENWSFSNRLIRQKVPVGIDYGMDVHRARELAVEAATGVDRVLPEPAPLCHLVSFGDNSVNLELRFWINDPERGVANVRSAVMLRIWDLYHENGIAFPFPQRDLHIRSSVPLQVELASEGRTGRKRAAKAADDD